MCKMMNKIMFFDDAIINYTNDKIDTDYTDAKKLFLEASEKCSISEMSYFLRYPHIDINDTIDSITALHNVCRSSCNGFKKNIIKNAVEFLLFKGANVNAKTSFGDTPLHYLAEGASYGNEDLSEIHYKSHKTNF